MIKIAAKNKIKKMAKRAKSLRENVNTAGLSLDFILKQRNLDLSAISVEERPQIFKLID